MGDKKEKCELLKKKANKTYYYKCKSVDCDKQCLIYVLWEHLEVEKEGKKLIVGTSIKEVGCECVKVDSDKWGGTPSGPQSCKEENTYSEKVEKEGKKYEKCFVRCVNESCDKDKGKECVYSIKYKNPDKELGEMDTMGCECVKWDAL